MCQHVGQGCACRLALTLERMPVLDSLDISHNSLPALPDSLWTLGTLQHLNLSDNGIGNVSGPSLVRLQQLTTLDLSANPLRSLPWDALSAMPNLSELRAAHLRCAASDRARLEDELVRMRPSLSHIETLEVSFLQ